MTKARELVAESDVPTLRASLDCVEVRAQPSRVFDVMFALLARARDEGHAAQAFADSLLCLARIAHHDDDSERRLHALEASGEPLADILIRAQLREESPEDVLLSAVRAIPDEAARIALARAMIALGLAMQDPPSPLVMAAWDAVRTAAAISPEAWRELLSEARAS
jgi:hypothetical protein